MKKYTVRWDPMNGSVYPEGHVEEQIANFIASGGEWVVGQPVIIVALQAAVQSSTISVDDIDFIGSDGNKYPIDSDGMFERMYPNNFNDLTIKYLLQMF